MPLDPANVQWDAPHPDNVSWDSRSGDNAAVSEIKKSLPKTGSFSESIAHGGTFGLSDEIEAGLSAPLQYGLDTLTGKNDLHVGDLVAGKQKPTLGNYYHANLENIREGQENYAKEHPVLNTVGEVVGGAMDLNPEAIGEAVAKGFWPTVAKGGTTGAAIGATQGFGEGEGVTGRLKGALVGGITGGAVGAAAPAVVPWVIGGARAAGSMIQRAIAPWTKNLDSFIDETVGNVLNRAAGDSGANFEAPPLPGMAPTTGQATNNPGLKWLERSVEQSTPEAADASAQARTANNQAIQSAIGNLGDLQSNAAVDMNTAVEKASKAANTSTRAAWKAANVDETTGISAPQFQDHVKDYLDGLTVAARKNIPGDVLDILHQLAEQGTTDLGEIQDVRSNVTDALREAAFNRQSNKARVLGGLADTISDFIDNIPRPAEAAEAYDTARDATKQMKKTFNTPKDVRNVMGVDRYGADKTPLSAVADTFIRSGKGAPEAFQSYLDAVDSNLKSAARPGQTAPERIAAVTEARQDVESGYQAARDAFAQRFLDKVTTTASDQAGSPIISAAKVKNFIDDHQHVINSKIFDDDQRDLITRIGQAADMANRTVNAGAKGGPDTFAKLQGKTFLDVLIGPGASKLIPLASTVAGAHVGGPVGAAAGLTAALVGESRIENLLYGATRDKALALVHEAMNTPDLAKTLMQSASAKAAMQIPAPQRRLIYSVLGARAGVALEPNAEQKANGYIANDNQGQNVLTQ